MKVCTMCGEEIKIYPKKTPRISKIVALLLPFPVVREVQKFYAEKFKANEGFCDKCVAWRRMKDDTSDVDKDADK